jgi:hypothetical protein
LLLSSLLPPVPPFPLPLPSFLCAIVLPAPVVVSSFAIFVFPASPLLPFNNRKISPLHQT